MLGPGCCHCGHTVTINTGFCGSARVPSVLVQLKVGSTVAYSGTSDSSGQLVLSGVLDGTYTLATTTGSVVASAGQTVTVSGADVTKLFVVEPTTMNFSPGGTATRTGPGQWGVTFTAGLSGTYYDGASNTCKTATGVRVVLGLVCNTATGGGFKMTNSNETSNCADPAHPGLCSTGDLGSGTGLLNNGANSNETYSTAPVPFSLSFTFPSTTPVTGFGAGICADQQMAITACTVTF
jgi:hypothetical protein